MIAASSQIYNSHRWRQGLPFEPRPPSTQRLACDSSVVLLEPFSSAKSRMNLSQIFCDGPFVVDET